MTLSKRVARAVAGGVFVTLLFFASAELLIRAAYSVRNSMTHVIPLPYTIGGEYGPAPPWADGLRILVPDKDLIWKNRPSLRRRYVDIFAPVQFEEERTTLLRRFISATPESLRRSPMWEISLNSEGFRDAEFPGQKSASSFRILCLGDSWTFGANVGQDQAYPQRLQTLLAGAFPAAQVEVFNLGVLGYSSFQGLELLKRKGLHWQPDLVTIGFAMNDAVVDGYRDKDLPGQREPVSLRSRLAGLLEHIESYKLLRYLALVMKYRPKSMGEKLRASVGSQPGEGTAAQYEQMEPWTRVSLADYEKNIREMIRLAQSRGASVILLFNSLDDSPYLGVLKGISSDRKIPLVDSRALIVLARQAIEDKLQEDLGLQPVPVPHPRDAPGETTVVFRVRASKDAVTRGIYIAGNHPKLGNLAPNTVAMYDDGTHGDQRAGDGVWSYQASFASGMVLYYVYTNSGEKGRWEGLDVPDARKLRVAPPGEKPVQFTPIESFGQMYLQADPWHTNAAGYEIIARAVLDVLKNDAGFTQHLARGK